MAATHGDPGEARPDVRVSGRDPARRGFVRLCLDQLVWLRRSERVVDPEEMALMNFKFQTSNLKSSEHGIGVRGVGAVSPAGWGMEPLRVALDRAAALAVRELA